MKYEALICLPFWTAREAGVAEQPCRANTPGATRSICRATAFGRPRQRPAGAPLRTAVIVPLQLARPNGLYRENKIHRRLKIKYY